MLSPLARVLSREAMLTFRKSLHSLGTQFSHPFYKSRFQRSSVPIYSVSIPVEIIGPVGGGGGRWEREAEVW